MMKWGKEEAEGRSGVWGWYLSYGTKYQWKIPVPNTSAATTFGPGTVTV